jgi:hypothetical protein
VDDIVAALARAKTPGSRKDDDEEEEEDDDDDRVGVAVEAVETLAAHPDGRRLLAPTAASVLPELIRHVAAAAAMPKPNQTGERETDGAAAKPTGGSFGGASESESPRAAAGDANASDKKEGDARRVSRAKKKKKKKKKPPPTPAQACARTALLVHTLYSVAKEAEFEREGSAWPMLLASTDELLPAFVAMLAPPPSDAVGQKTPAAASDAAAAAAAALPLPEMLSELGRNALIVLAEMADPANSRVDPEAGARWAQHVVGERPDLVGLLIDIMGGGDPSAGRPRRRAGGNAEAFTLSASSDAREARTAYVSFAHRASLGRPSIPDPGEVADEEAGAAAESAGFLRFGVDEDRFALTSDCAHIAAAAVFGIVSHDECLETLLASLAKRTAREGGGSAGVSALVSRAVVLLADALPRRRRREGKKKKASEEKGSNRTTALGENAGSNQTTALGSLRSGDAAPDADSDASSDSDAPDDAHQAACASGGAGVEAAGLIARFASHPGGRAALLDHAPGVVSYLLPCLRSELGQTAAFAARAVCALARSEDGARALLRFPRPDALSAALAGMLPRARLVGDNDHGGGPNDASRAAAARERRAWAELEIDPRRAFATDSFAFAAADSGPDSGVSGVSAERALVERARILTRAAEIVSAPLAAILHRKEELSPARFEATRTRVVDPLIALLDETIDRAKEKDADRIVLNRTVAARRALESRSGNLRDAQREAHVAKRASSAGFDEEKPGSPSRRHPDPPRAETETDAPRSETETSPDGRAAAQVRSEVVIAVASLAQIKAWRWRLLDVRGAAPRAPRALTEALGETLFGGASSPSRVASEPSDKECSPPPPRVTDPDSDSDSPAGETTTSTSSRARTRASSSSPGPGPPSPARLVGALARLLRDHHAEVVFNALYCVNCMMGEPPQSWGRGRDPTREEDDAARAAFVRAAGEIHPRDCLEAGLAATLRRAPTANAAPLSEGRVVSDLPEDPVTVDAGGSGGDARRRSSSDAANPNPNSNSNLTGGGSDGGAASDSEEDSEAFGPAPDCRLNATLVTANIAGDASGRAALFDRGGEALIAGLAAMLLGPDADCAMLAAYSLGELATPLEDETMSEEEAPFSFSSSLDATVTGSSSLGACPAWRALGVSPSLGVLLDARAPESEETAATREARESADRMRRLARGPIGYFTDALRNMQNGVSGVSATGTGTTSSGPAPSFAETYPALASSSRHARSAALRVLAASRGGHARRFVTHGEVPDSRPDPAPLRRALDLHAKRRWTLEMLRWELGPVSAGVPALAGVALACDRERPLEDLCRHCALPGLEKFEGFVTSGGGSGVTSNLDDGPPPDAGGFLPPPRGGVAVRFRAERGAGAAVRREWMSLVAENASDGSLALFASYDGGVTLHPHPSSGAACEHHLEYFAALGRVAATALYHGETLPLRLSASFWDRVLGKPLRTRELEALDPTLFKHKVGHVRALGPEALGVTWSDEADHACGGVFTGDPGAVEPLLSAEVREPDDDVDVAWEAGSGGSSDAEKFVSNAQTERFVRALAYRRVLGSVMAQTAAFASGFGAVVPPPLMRRLGGVLTGEDLASLVAGAKGAVDAGDWKAHSAYADADVARGFTARCFWRCVEAIFTDEERLEVVQFATGLAAVPAGGFKNLVGYMGDQAPFTVGELPPPRRDEPGALPMAHACFNTIRLPRLRESDFQDERETIPIPRGWRWTGARGRWRGGSGSPSGAEDEGSTTFEYRT